MLRKMTAILVTLCLALTLVPVTAFAEEAPATPGNLDTATEGDIETATEGNLDTATPGDLDTATEGDFDASTPGDIDTATQGDLDTATPGNIATPGDFSTPGTTTPPSADGTPPTEGNGDTDDDNSPPVEGWPEGPGWSEPATPGTVATPANADMLAADIMPLQSSDTEIDLTDSTTASGTNWAYDNTSKVFTINSGADVTITGNVSDGTRIVVDGDATITLNGVTISGLGSDQCPLLLNAGANLTLQIEGVNTLAAGIYGAGIQITGAELTIDGTGSLIANGGHGGAGIGGNYLAFGGAVTINGGTVTANGGFNGAGIGSGYSSGVTDFDGGTLTMEGDAVVYASDLEESSTYGGPNMSGVTNGILFVDDEGTVYGDMVLQDNLTVEPGQTLTVPPSAGLTVPPGVTLTNEGTIENDGTITNYGTIDNSGTINNSGTIDSADGEYNGSLPTGGAFLPPPTEPGQLTVVYNTGDDMEAKITAALAAAGMTAGDVTGIKVTGNADEITGDNWDYLINLYSSDDGSGGEDWTALTTLDLSKMAGLRNIARDDFSNAHLNEKLTNVSLPDSLTAIGNYTFWGCPNLDLSKLPDDLTDIGIMAFSECTDLNLTELPSGVTVIEQSAFFSCANLALTALPSGVTEIGVFAFSDCTSLTSIEIPAGLSSIGYGAFIDCTNLKKLIFNGSTAPTLEASSFANVSPFGTLLFPDGADYDAVKAALPPDWVYKLQPDVTFTAQNGGVVNLASPTDLVLGADGSLLSGHDFEELQFIRLSDRELSALLANGRYGITGMNWASPNLTVPAMVFGALEGQEPLTAGDYRVHMVFSDSLNEEFDYYADFTVINDPGPPPPPPPSQVRTPTANPNGGEFSGSVSVTLTSGTTGSTIYYTTDGSLPTTGSTSYTGPFTLTDTATVKAFAAMPGMTDSAVMSVTFTKKTAPPPPTPTPQPSPGRDSDSDSGGSSYTPRTTPAAPRHTLRKGDGYYDTILSRAIETRLYADLPVMGKTTGAEVNRFRQFFERWYSNKIRVIHFDHAGKWESPVRVAAKIDLAEWDTKRLVFYYYDPKHNKITRLYPEYRIDTNGFLHFITEYAGEIIISEGEFERR